MFNLLRSTEIVILDSIWSSNVFIYLMFSSMTHQSFGFGFQGVRISKYFKTIRNQIRTIPLAISVDSYIYIFVQKLRPLRKIAFDLH